MKMEDVEIGMRVWVPDTVIGGTGEEDVAGEIVGTSTIPDHLHVRVDSELFTVPWASITVPWASIHPMGPADPPTPTSALDEDVLVGRARAYQTGRSDGIQERDTEWAGKMASVVPTTCSPFDPEQVGKYVIALRAEAIASEDARHEAAERVPNLLSVMQDLADGTGLVIQSDTPPEVHEMLKIMLPDLKYVVGDTVYVRELNGRPITPKTKSGSNSGTQPAAKSTGGRDWAGKSISDELYKRVEDYILGNMRTVDAMKLTHELMLEGYDLSMLPPFIPKDKFNGIYPGKPMTEPDPPKKRWYQRHD